METDLSKLPPPPKGQTGIQPSDLSKLPPPPKGQTGLTLQQIIAQQNPTAPPPKNSSPVITAVKNTMSDYHNAIPSFLEAAGSGDATPNDLGPDGKPIGNFTANARNIAVGALRATANGIGTIFAPITNAIQSASDSFAQNAKDPLNPNKPLTDNPVVSKVLNLFDGTNHAMNTWATKNPEQAKNLQSAITIALTAVGGGENGLDKPIVSGEFPTTIQGLKELPSDIKNTLTKGIQTISDATKTIAETVKNTKQSFSSPAEVKAIQQSIQDTMPLQSKDVRIDELRNSYPDSGSGKGGITREGVMGKSTPQSTEADIARGTTAHEYIKGETDPVKKIQNINQGIKDTSEGTNKFLDKNSAHVNFEDIRGYMEHNNTPPENITKDPTASESYRRSTENALNTIYKTMKDTANKTGSFDGATPGSDIRQARIAVDQQITKELGEETFGTPQYKGIKAAEVNARNIINRMSEDMVRYPGQLEAVNKYNDFIDTLKSRNADVQIDPQYEAELKDKFGLKSTPESESAAQKLADQHTKMSQLYEARDNLIEKYQANVGKNRWQEFLKNNPKIRRVIKYGALIGGASFIGHEL